MRVLRDRFNYLFRSTKGLALVAIALISLVTVLLGTLSGPMAEWGVKDWVVQRLGIDLVPAEREGRIIMLYHTIAMAVVAIEVYFITDWLKMQIHQRRIINATITLGYVTALFFGLGFAYFGHSRLFHGLFLFGQALVFFAGLMLAVALWPWKRAYRLEADSHYARGPGGIDLERAAFFVMTVATLGSALFGAWAGASWGSGFETFLAEDLIREPHKTPLQLAVIGHLHIMLTLIGVALTLLIGRWLDFRGPLHKVAMPLMVVGTIVTTIGVWSVVPFEAIAHMIIYAGSTLVMLAALMLVIFGWRQLIRQGIGPEAKRAGFWQRLKALLHDPLKFGALWQMVYMNFTVSGVGIFMAAKLEDIFRVWPAREERITLTGHWHILSGIIATILLLYYADLAGLKGRARRWFGWLVILGSDVAFGAVTVFSIKRLFVSEAAQQPVVDWTMLLADLGLALVLVVLAAFMVWRLGDLFRRRGRWKEELKEAGLAASRPEEVVQQVPAESRAGDSGGTEADGTLWQEVA